ncbi:MAG: hypothetical protein DHS20C02_13750 [Micavibrio sp.]|nr:MAG: hypothetical protein DHS20C02_13750 [Micavibrio sp.]
MRNSQSGNVLFYVLIAVALLGTLSYAVTNSNRGNVQQLTQDKARLMASEIIEYGNVLGNAVAQLKLRGVSDTDLCFDDPQWPVSYNHAGCADNLNKVFHVSGAGAIWAEVNSEAMDATATPDNLWHFYADNEIEEVGTTCGNAACSDLIMVVDELSQTVCIEMNDLLGIVNPGDVPPTDAGLAETLYIGAYGHNNVIGDEVGGAEITGKTAACYQKTGAPAEYVFYKVLIAR